MTTDARLHHPAARRPVGGRGPSNHLRLVPVGGSPDSAAPPGSEGRADDWKNVAWSEERIRAEMGEFYDSPWGACLPKPARIGLDSVLLPASAPRPFDGYSGVAFLDDVLDVDTVSRHDTGATPALQALPSALRAWVRFNRRACGSSDASLTLALLEHVDHLEPAWQEAVHDLRQRRSHPSRPQPTSA